MVLPFVVMFVRNLPTTCLSTARIALDKFFGPSSTTALGMVQITPSLVFDCSSQPAADAAIEHL
jgi:hypothetical protein